MGGDHYGTSIHMFGEQVSTYAEENFPHVEPLGPRHSNSTPMDGKCCYMEQQTEERDDDGFAGNHSTSTLVQTS